MTTHHPRVIFFLQNAVHLDGRGALLSQIEAYIPLP